MTKREFNPYSASSNARHSLVSWFGQVDKLRVSSKPGLNATLVKDKEAVLVGWHLVNSSVAALQLNFYDQTTLPTAGDEIDWILRELPDSASTADSGRPMNGSVPSADDSPCLVAAVRSSKMSEARANVK
jgi:hypothetical protein